MPAVTCCGNGGWDEMFGHRTAERDARRYRRKGVSKAGRRLLDGITADGIEGSSVLEVGGGVGALQIELLEAGAARSVNVELVPAYEPAARSLLEEHGLTDRVERRFGDIAQGVEGVAPANIVIMHRVVCCYPDADALIRAACERATDRLAMTVPRENAWLRAGVVTMNAWFWLRRMTFRTYVHPVSRMVEIAEQAGFALRHQANDRVWDTLILQRAEAY
jgi:hypothetical protein